MNIVTLDVDYYIRTYYDPMYDEFGVIAKAGWKRFYFDQMNDTLRHMINDVSMNIPEGDIPEPPKVNRITIELPRPYSYAKVKESDYEQNKWMIDNYLLDHIDREVMNYLDVQEEIYNMDVKFDIRWHRIDPPKI